MKKIFIVLSILLLVVLTSCTISDSNIQDKIVSPQNNTSPIQGKWLIDEKVATIEEEVVAEEIITFDLAVEEDDYIGREVLFSKDAIIVADDYADNPTFKSKNVNTKDYLLYKYKINPSILGITSDSVQILSSSKNNQLFYEFVIYNEDNLLIFLDSSFYKLEKIADEVSTEEVNRYISIELNQMMRIGDSIGVEDVNTGVLLGIKIPTYDEENEIPDWDYKTIWINSSDRNLTEYELDQLLLPRKNGFWIVDVERDNTDSGIYDRIVSTPQFTSIIRDFSGEGFLMGSSDSPVSLIANKTTILKDILFVGNDYISIEKTDVNNKNRKTLEVYAMDIIEEERPVKLSDIVEDGEFLFNEGSQNIQSIGDKVLQNQANVGLVRNNGYWILKGRINYNQNEDELHKDFNIKAIPPKTMVSYDELSLPWDAINAEFPRALDAFSSPNGEFIILVIGNELQVYPTENGEILSKDPISRIELPNNASIIMAEWALGRYPDIWENEMIKQGGKILE